MNASRAVAHLWSAIVPMMGVIGNDMMLDLGASPAVCPACAAMQHQSNMREYFVASKCPFPKMDWTCVASPCGVRGAVAQNATQSGGNANIRGAVTFVRAMVGSGVHNVLAFPGTT